MNFQNHQPLPKGTLPNTELKQLKSSWKLTDKLTLLKYLVTSPGTKLGAKIIFKTTLWIGTTVLFYKIYSDWKYTERRNAGLYLSDLEEVKLAELTRRKN